MPKKTLNLSSFVEAAEHEAGQSAGRPVDEQARALPSPARAKREGEAARFAERTQMNFNSIPLVTKQAIEEEARRRGYRYPVQLIYELLREAGLPAPDPNNLRGR